MTFILILLLSKGLTISLPNNFNHQIYPSDLPVVFTVKNIYWSKIPILFMVKIFNCTFFVVHM